MSQDLTGPTLTRYPGQRIHVAGIVIEVVDVSGGKARIKVLAPKGMEIMREELLPVGERVLAKK